MTISHTMKMVAISAATVMSMSACTQGSDASTDPEEVVAAPIPEEVAVTRIDCDDMGDAAVWIETSADGAVSYVTQAQSEMTPNASAEKLLLEPTGMSAGREGARLGDESGKVTVWMLDDGSAEVSDNGMEFTCPAE